MPDETADVEGMSVPKGVVLVCWSADVRPGVQAVGIVALKDGASLPAGGAIPLTARLRTRSAQRALSWLTMHGSADPRAAVVAAIERYVTALPLNRTDEGFA